MPWNWILPSQNSILAGCHSRMKSVHMFRFLFFKAGGEIGSEGFMSLGDGLKSNLSLTSLYLCVSCQTSFSFILHQQGFSFFQGTWLVQITNKLWLINCNQTSLWQTFGCETPFSENHWKWLFLFYIPLFVGKMCFVVFLSSLWSVFEQVIQLSSHISNRMCFPQNCC